MIKITAEKIKEIRKENNLSQEQLGDILGVHPQYISNIERGTKPVSHKLIEKLEQKGLLIYEEASPERPDWLKDLTQKEELMLQEMIEKDKELLSLFFGACNGDQKKIKLFCGYLSSKYGVDVDL